VSLRVCYESVRDIACHAQTNAPSKTKSFTFLID
jgi:hypothetical protein